MSGFEVAGIALAVFPILVDGMVRFADGVQTIKQWRRYRVRLEHYADFIATQRVYYQDTLEELLTDIVQSEDEIVDLMAQPRGNIWKKPEYETKLMQRLGRSHAVYLRTSDKLVNALSSMSEKLDIDHSGKVSPTELSRVEREMKRIKITLSKNIYKEILDTIDKANKDLRDITHQNIYLEPVRRKRRSERPLTVIKLIRKHAKSLYRVIITGGTWNCSCRMLHMASLRLESRPNALEAKNEDTVPNLRFRIIMCTVPERDGPRIMSQWHEVEIISSLDVNIPDTISVGLQNRNRSVRFAPDPLSSTTTDTLQELAIDQNCETIADMCGALCASHEPQRVFGCLVDERDDKHKHYLCRADSIIDPQTRSESLDDLLSRGPSGSLLSRNDRLRTAVTLASSILQLSGTAWFNPQWSSKDIFFHEKNDSSRNPSYSYPYMNWKRCLSCNNIPDSLDSHSRDDQKFRIQVLFALGLTLIELCFGKTLAEMRTPEDGDPSDASTAINIGHRLCNSVYSEMGTSYGDAVRRCLHQPFDIRDLSLDNEELQQKVFDEIVTPLNEDFLNFNGKLRIR